MVLAALADGPATVVGALVSRDSTLMIDALRALGVTIDDTDDGSLRVCPPPRLTAAPDGIDCGLAGTVMRFVPPLAALADGVTRFTGDPHASLRPMAGLLDGLRQLGVCVDGDGLPFSIGPGTPRCGDEIVIDSSPSSQFLSGLILIGCRIPGGLRIRHEGDSVPSRPHIAMTVEMLRSRGVDVIEHDSMAWEVREGVVRAQDTVIEPDLTNAAAFLAAAAVTGGRVRVPRWPRHSLQPGALFLDVATGMGCEVIAEADAVTLQGPRRLRGIEVDLHAASELTPVVAALAATAEGITRITGVAHIRGHETDRLRALATELNRLGVSATELPDGLEIEGSPLRETDPVELSTYADHRMAHFAAVVALTRTGVRVDDIGCVSKTMPDFMPRWTGLVDA